MHVSDNNFETTSSDKIWIEYLKETNFILLIQNSNAMSERIFSLIKTEQKCYQNRLLLKNLEVKLIIKFNFEFLMRPAIAPNNSNKCNLI